MYHEKDTVGLRRLYDTVEVHHRGLQALGVNASTYEEIVVPSILTKLPENAEWKTEILNELLCELELREHCLRICYVSTVDALFVLVRGIFPVIIRLKIYVTM